MHIYLCVRAGARELGCSPARMGGGGGAGGRAETGAGAEAGAGAAPWDCLRLAKGAPDGDPRDGPLVSWKPNAEGLAGRAEATQVCSGSQCPSHPPPREGLGLREPKSWDVGQGLKERGGKEPTAPGIPRRSPIQVLTRPDPA